MFACLLLSTRFYAQIVHAQLQYGLAINRLTASQIKTLKDARNECLQRIYGASKRASTKAMRHLSRLPTMKERINILQAQSLFRSFTLPKDALLTELMLHIQHDRHPAMARTVQVFTLEKYTSSSGRAQSQDFQGHLETISVTRSRLLKIT